MPDQTREEIHLKNYRGLIRQMVGEQPAPSSAPRPLPQFPSVYYDGTNDRPAFNNWLRTLLLYFRASMMCGEENDDVRVSTAAKYLKGIARDWFFTTVAAPGSSVPYKFEEVVIGVAQVFLASRYVRLMPQPPKYTPRTTTRAFYFQLQHWYEMEITTGTENQRDSRIEDAFHLRMREAMLEMYPTESVLIEHWAVNLDPGSVEKMLDVTQCMLVLFEENKQQAQERSKEGRRR